MSGPKYSLQPRFVSQKLNTSLEEPEEFTVMSDRFIRAKEIYRKTGLSRSTIWRLEQQGDFPRRRLIAPHTVGWLETEVERWLKSRQPKPTNANNAQEARK